MGQFFLGLFGAILSMLALKYRRAVGDMFGETEFVSKVGGIYNLVIMVATFAFMYSLLVMFGLTDVVMLPFTGLFNFG
ncbi:hypothetical protein KJ652_04595 [Patescibacteria group bacterium]|nr:hypothetical protein [Patescibacteria group bacterium]MBU1123845.1 hypothetical protein [Patescibacteria group bacterium]